MQDKYIDREAVRREACKGCTMWDGGNICHDADPCEKLIAAFLNAPAADVASVVRCKDCKYVRNLGFNFGGLRHDSYFCVYNGPVSTGGDDFCSHGELQTNGGGSNDVYD